MLTPYPIGSTAYLREPERNGDRCGVIVSKGGGMIRLLLESGRQASYFYNELF